jgi:hypothetical protein
MMARRNYDPSVDRQELRLLVEELSKIRRSFSRTACLVRGSFQTIRRKCGKSPCRCTRGQLHESLVFIDRSSGRPVVRKAKLGQYQEMKKATEDYQSLRRLRARLAKLNREILERCDRLLDHRLEDGRRLLTRWARK